MLEASPGRICRKNSVANGKEGVDGSSPSEGFEFSPAAFGCVERDREARATTQNGQRSRRSQTCFSRVSASRACLQERRDANSPVSRVSWGITQPPPPLRKKRQILRTRRPKYLRLQL